VQGTLIVTILTVQSSYLHVIEEPLRDNASVPDTVQWWLAPTGAWRIRTYALDHDIHAHSIGPVESAKELALANTQKHYGDIIQSRHIIELTDCFDANETRAFRVTGLEPRLEIAEGRFAFWKPDDAPYHTQSQPE
jgi:hypothetical protein